MNQKPCTKFASTCEKARIYVENDMPIGVFHDFLMEMKGIMVDRMIEAHKQQVAEMEAMRKLDQSDDSQNLVMENKGEANECRGSESTI